MTPAGRWHWAIEESCPIKFEAHCVISFISVPPLNLRHTVSFHSFLPSSIQSQYVPQLLNTNLLLGQKTGNDPALVISPRACTLSKYHRTHTSVKNISVAVKNIWSGCANIMCWCATVWLISYKHIFAWGHVGVSGVQCTMGKCTIVFGSQENKQFQQLFYYLV